jgi:hypothetical protein
MNLFAAHTQWASRPPDERYQSLESLTKAVRSRASASVESNFSARELAESAVEEIGTNGKIAVGGNQLTNWSLTQLSQLVGAPSGYIRELPPALAVANLQHGLRNRLNERHDGDLNLLVARTGIEGVLRACTSQRYSRIWDHEVLAAVQKHADGFRPPLGFRDGQWGADLVPSGLYASDRDVFAFLVNEENPLVVGNDVLHRGFYCWNSEVGAAAFGWSTFYYRMVCGNNIIWGASNIRETRVRHVGKAARTALEETFPAALDELRALGPQKSEHLEIVTAQKDELATTADKAVEALRERGFTGREAREGVVAAEREEEMPFTRWGLLQGLTAYARTMRATDARVELERKAPKILMPSLN